MSEATRTHNEQIDTLRTQVALTQAGVGQSLAQATQALAQQAQSAREAQDTALRDITELLERGVLRKSEASGRSTRYDLSELG